MMFMSLLCQGKPQNTEKACKSEVELKQSTIFFYFVVGYKVDEGFHSQHHAVNCVLLCLIAKAETVLSLCIDEFLLLYQICYRIFPPAG